MTKARQTGFTLIEMMIVVAILGVVAAIALPSYFDQIRKSRRSDAITALSQVQQVQESYRANKTQYGTHFIVVSGALKGAGLTGDANAATTYATSNNHYQLTLPAAGPNSYEVRAEAQSGQVKDGKCKYLQVEMSGGTVLYKSGTTTAVANGTSDNNLCWKR